MTPFVPAWTMARVHGGRCAYNPRAPLGASRWLSLDSAVLDALTGGAITVMGEMPILCARAVATPDALALLHAAGLPVAQDIRRYDGESGYLDQLRQFAAAHRRVVVQHWHPAAELAEEVWDVPSRLLAWLNNKANLAQLVPAPHVPPRQVLSRARLTQADISVPCVIKAATDESTGGGGDVMICPAASELTHAQEYFASVESVVIEAFLPIARNWCLNYAVCADGKVAYLGAAEQVSDVNGRYGGNWLDASLDAQSPAVQLGRVIAANGAALGYRGCLGVDVGVLENGAIVAFDLNFRMNGSTAPLMLYPAIAQRRGHPVARFRSWTSAHPHAQVLRAITPALEAGWFVPLSSFDPAAGNYPGASARIAGLLLGASREEVTAREIEFSDLFA